MDVGLKEAACSGDVEFLRRAAASQPPHYFLTQYVAAHEYDEEAGNIFHLATQNGKVEFVREALKILPITIQQKQKLLSQNSSMNRTPLHLAAALKKESDSFEIVQLILKVYESHSDPYIRKPWLKFNGESYPPLHLALRQRNEKSALQILSMDMKSLCSTEDEDDNSPLFLAVKKGCDKVAEKILMSSFSYSLSGKYGSTPLHFVPNSTEAVSRLLLKKHPELVGKKDNDGYNMLNKWVEITDSVRPFELLLTNEFPEVRTKVFTNLIYQSYDTKLKTPLHVVAENKNKNKIGKAIIKGYKIEARKSNDRSNPPWRKKDSNENTPLETALRNENEELALDLISLDSTLCEILDNVGESPLITAVGFGCEEVVEKILDDCDVTFTMLRSNYNGKTVLHSLPYVSEEIGKRLLEKFWWMINVRDKHEKTALDYAEEEKEAWLIELLMEPFLIQKEPFDWISACEKKETWPILAFIDNCEDLQKVYQEQNDTPLHHITLQTYDEYMNLLKKPSIAGLKNATDNRSATPLHRALERKDIHFVKALLEEGVEQNIKDSHGKTAKSMLARLCKENDDWDKIRRQKHVSRHLKTTYIKAETNVDQMRNTLSVVAALLATITFTAGFTVPGGLNDETGIAILPKKVAFLVFLIADAYALCMSMLVLFCLIWSMVSDKNVSYILVDRSVLILMQALYGTMVAFMTAIYIVIPRKYLWAVIIIFIMCSFIVISLDRTILHYIVLKLLPAANKDLDQTLEKENLVPSRISTSWAEEESSITSRNQNLLLDGEEDVLLLKSKSISKQNIHQDQKDEHPSPNKRTTAGTNSKLHQNATSFARMNNATPANNDDEDEEDQIRSMEEGVFSSGNEDGNADGTCNNSLQIVVYQKDEKILKT